MSKWNRRIFAAILTLTMLAGMPIAARDNHPLGAASAEGYFWYDEYDKWEVDGWDWDDDYIVTQHDDYNDDFVHYQYYDEQDYASCWDDDRHLNFTLTNPKDNGTALANQPITIKWSNVSEVDYWRVEVFRNGVWFMYETVYSGTSLPTIDAKWATSGSRFIVNIEPVIDRDPNVAMESFSFTVK